MLSVLPLARLAFLLIVAIAPFQAAAAPAQKVILIVGDSISAAYGLPTGTGWASLLQQRLATQRYPYRVVNASISGDTTAGGRSRLEALLKQHRPAVTIVELGGNDGLRGGNLELMRGNLDAMARAAQEAGSRVLLVGMRLPPNYGNAYVQRFADAYTSVAKARKVPLVPFFFEGFGEDVSQFQADRIHPAAGAQSRLLDNVWPYLAKLLGPAEKAA